jgi:hypothetical protein
MNWFNKIAAGYGYHGTDPTQIRNIKSNGLRAGTFFSSNESDISPYADGVYLRFPFPRQYRKRIGRGDYYTTLEIIPSQSIEVKKGTWGNYKRL